ncbi:hypothetical protein B0H34DRAFT_508600 [Crassisporium funariophilum]|nr:hypothetical protein B0H34DRAFT_508600 [Crassisporium funariophilum]
MRLNLATFISFLLFVVLEAQADCPPSNDAILTMTAPLEAKFQEVCKQGIKPGGAADVAWVKKTIFPKYLTKAFIGKELPAGLNKDIDALMSKCHKNSYNYCSKVDRAAMSNCAKTQMGSLALKYGAQLPAYCPLLDKIVTDWPSKHEKGALALFSMYCKSKGKKC